MKCRFILTNGKHCKCNATLNNSYCHLHKKCLSIIAMHYKLTFISYMIVICIFLNIHILSIFYDNNALHTSLHVKNFILEYVHYIKQLLYISSEKILLIYKKCTNI